WANGREDYYMLDARELGLPRVAAEALRGGAPADNAAISRNVLAGRPGPQRDIVVLNAAAALLVAGLAADWPAAIGLAGESIDAGHARAKLEALARVSHAPLVSK